MKFLARFLQLLLVMQSMVHSEEVSIPWDPSLSIHISVYYVYPDDMVYFKPCRANQSHGIYYTDNKTVYDNCMHPTKIPRDV